MSQKSLQKPSKKRETYHHGDLRRTLLHAARAEIAAHGAQTLSLASLARRAGVAQSAPYRHFADREELLIALAIEGFEEFTAALLRGAGDGGAAGALKRMALAYLRFGEDNVELYRLMFASRLVPESPEGSPLQEAAAASFQPLLERVATGGARRSQIAAHVKWAQLHGLVMLKADGFVDDTAEDLLAAISL